MTNFFKKGQKVDKNSTYLKMRLNKPHIICKLNLSKVDKNHFFSPEKPEKHEKKIPKNSFIPEKKSPEI